MKKITLDQKAMCSKEFGIRISTLENEPQVAKLLKSATRKSFKGEIIWSNRPK